MMYSNIGLSFRETLPLKGLSHEIDQESQIVSISQCCNFYGKALMFLTTRIKSNPFMAE